jgi:uncharacterized glyoxalase superfamily protein PhnB
MRNSASTENRFSWQTDTLRWKPSACGADRLGGTTVNFWIDVFDLDAALERALAAGATLKESIQPSTEGVRRCRIADPTGHIWTLAGT